MRHLSVLACLSLAMTACATGSGAVYDPAVESPTFSATLPAMGGSETSLRQTDEEADSLPIGIGLTASPSTFLLAGAYDVPVDEQLTVGPALHIGFGDDRILIGPHAKAKYWLPGALEGPDGRTKLRPYVAAGIGGVYYDEPGQSSDVAFFLTGGAGFRFLTGDAYRIGSEALINWAPNKVGDERTWFSWEVLQVVFDF